MQLSGSSSTPSGFDEQRFQLNANPERFTGSDLVIAEFPSPVLRAPNAEVTEFDESLASLCAECFSVLYEASGVGIAAPQVCSAGARW